MHTEDDPSAETRALRILERNSQLSDLYLKLTDSFENNLSLVNFLLSMLLTGLMDPSRRLGVLFILCQLTDDPDFSDPVAQFWAFGPSELERLMLYELVIEKNFSEFLSLSLSQLPGQLLALRAKRKLAPGLVEERMGEVLSPPEGGATFPTPPLCLVDPHAFDAETNATLFGLFDPLPELSRRRSGLEPLLCPLAPAFLLPLPREARPGPEGPLGVPIAVFGPVLDPCMNNKMYVNASLQNFGGVGLEEQAKLQELIASFPDLLEEPVLLDRAEKLVNEHPEFALGLLKTLRRARRPLFEKSPKQDARTDRP